MHHPIAIHCITRIKKVNEFEALQTKKFKSIKTNANKNQIKVA
jgi:hypothetical protein